MSTPKIVTKPRAPRPTIAKGKKAIARMLAMLPKEPTVFSGEDVLNNIRTNIVAAQACFVPSKLPTLKVVRNDANTPSNNGIKLRTGSGKCGMVWDLATSLCNGTPTCTNKPTVKNMVVAGVAIGLNKGNITQEYYTWCKYHSVNRAYCKA